MNDGEVKPLLVSGPQARKIIGIGTTKYFELVSAGTIRTKMVGGRRMVIYASLEELAREGTTQAA